MHFFPHPSGFVCNTIWDPQWGHSERVHTKRESICDENALRSLNPVPFHYLLTSSFVHCFCGESVLNVPVRSLCLSASGAGQIAVLLHSPHGERGNLLFFVTGRRQQYLWVVRIFAGRPCREFGTLFIFPSKGYEFHSGGTKIIDRTRVTKTVCWPFLCRLPPRHLNPVQWVG